MELPTFEAASVGVLGTLTEVKAFLGVPFLPFPLPTAVTGATTTGTVWGEGGAPSAAARATALGVPIRPGGTL